jgi:hypothetical protein
MTKAMLQIHQCKCQFQCNRYNANDKSNAANTSMQMPIPMQPYNTNNKSNAMTMTKAMQ